MNSTTMKCDKATAQQLVKYREILQKALKKNRALIEEIAADVDDRMIRGCNGILTSAHYVKDALKCTSNAFLSYEAALLEQIATVDYVLSSEQPTSGESND